MFNTVNFAAKPLSTEPSRQQIGFQGSRERTTLTAALGPDKDEVPHPERVLARMMPGEFWAYQNGVITGISKGLSYRDDIDPYVDNYQKNLGYKGDKARDMLTDAYQSGLMAGRIAHVRGLSSHAETTLQDWEERVRDLDASIKEEVNVDK